MECSFCVKIATLFGSVAWSPSSLIKDNIVDVATRNSGIRQDIRDCRELVCVDEWWAASIPSLFLDECWMVTIISFWSRSVWCCCYSDFERWCLFSFGAVKIKNNLHCLDCLGGAIAHLLGTWPPWHCVFVGLTQILGSTSIVHGTRHFYVYSRSRAHFRASPASIAAKAVLTWGLDKIVAVYNISGWCHPLPANLANFAQLKILKSNSTLLSSWMYTDYTRGIT